MSPTPSTTPTPELIEHVDALLARRGLSRSRASELAGLSRAYIRQWLDGTTRDPSHRALTAIAGVLGVTLDELLTPGSLAGVSEGGHEAFQADAPVRPAKAKKPPPRPLSRLPVAFPVQAGAWIVADEKLLDDEDGPPVTADPGWPAEAQRLVLVRGDSMDQIYPEGAWLHVVDFAAIGDARHGDICVIERRRDDGQVERTVKEAAMKSGKLIFRAVSNNPAWSEPLMLPPPGAADDEGAIVQVVAKVIGGYRFAPR